MEEQDEIEQPQSDTEEKEDKRNWGNCEQCPNPLYCQAAIADGYTIGYSAKSRNCYLVKDESDFPDLDKGALVSKDKDVMKVTVGVLL